MPTLTDRTMLPPVHHPLESPAADAARLLLRLGLLVLALGLPVLALVSRRAVFVIFPIAVVLILLSVLLRGPEPALRQFGAALISRLGLAALFVIGWAALSLSWTPFFAEAGDHLGKVLATGLAAVAVVAALSERTRTADLYLVPIGVAAGAAAAIALAFIPAPRLLIDPDIITMPRALVGLGILVWPALGALGARHHWSLAALLMLGVAAAAGLNFAPMVLAMLACGALSFILARSNLVQTARGLGLAVALLFIAAPALALLFDALLTARSAEASLLGQNVATWAAIIKADPARLLTGHGLDAATRAIQSGFLPAGAPRSLLFETWYELGLIGALSFAAMLYLAYGAAGRLGAAAGPALAGGITACLVLALTGQQTTQIWWVTLLAVALIATSLVVRGQYRTSRPFAPGTLTSEEAE